MRLVNPDLELMDAALAGDEPLAAALGRAVVPEWATFRGALQTIRDTMAAGGHDPLWGTRLFVASDPPELVGWGGFKGAPAEGVVELGYEIAVARRGRGLATEAVLAMVAEAAADPAVSTVIAHTLPEPNASTRVLEKAGFRHDRETAAGGERVWRFVLRLP